MVRREAKYGVVSINGIQELWEAEQIGMPKRNMGSRNADCGRAELFQRKRFRGAEAACRSEIEVTS